MKRRKIILITDKYDLDADAIILRLRAKGQLPVRVNFDDKSEETHFSLRLAGGSPGGRLRTRNRDVALDDIRSAYWRAPIAGSPLPDLSAAEAAFVRDESDHAWHGLWATLDCHWMNSPERTRQLQPRPAQLRQAVALGFDLPRTLITSQSEEVLAFSEECGGKLVFRVMSPPLLRQTSPGQNPEQSVRAICPVLVTSELLKEGAATMGNVPCYFQEYIERRSELRVMVIGNEVLVAEIEAKEPMRLPLHLLPDSESVTIRQGFLPDEIKARCVALAAACGVAYAVIELILTPDGRYVFLEINPNGQFSPVEKRLPELKVADAVVASLLRGNDPN